MTPSPKRVVPVPVTGISGVGVISATSHEQFDCSEHWLFRQYPLEQISPVAQFSSTVHDALHEAGGGGAGVLVGACVRIAVGVRVDAGRLVGVAVG